MVIFHLSKVKVGVSSDADDNARWIIVIVIIAGTFGAIAYEVIVTIITMQEAEAERK